MEVLNLYCIVLKNLIGEQCLMMFVIYFELQHNESSISYTYKFTSHPLGCANTFAVCYFLTSPFPYNSLIQSVILRSFLCISLKYIVVFDLCSTNLERRWSQCKWAVALVYQGAGEGQECSQRDCLLKLKRNSHEWPISRLAT